MRRYLGLSALMIFLLAACGNAGQEAGVSNMAEGYGEAAVFDKNPQMPLKFVDTTGKRYPWLAMYNPVQSIESRIAAPEGYARVPVAPNSFGAWLRGLPLKPGKPKVMLYNGEPKGFQDAQFAVLNIDVGNRDLQQCADAVMRLRAEYLYSEGLQDSIHFNFTSGANCPWSKWRQGYRPQIVGANVNWNKKAEPSDKYDVFKSYLNTVFTYAGTRSLEKEMKKIGTLKDLEIGDVLIQGGSPGHCVLVVDVAEQASTGKRKYMMVQSYMPAQDVHLLLNPNDEKYGPWYDADVSPIVTPEWTFIQQDLRRFN